MTFQLSLFSLEFYGTYLFTDIKNKHKKPNSVFIYSLNLLSYYLYISYYLIERLYNNLFISFEDSSVNLYCITDLVSFLHYSQL